MVLIIDAFGPLTAAVHGRRVDLGSPLQKTVLAVLLCCPGRTIPVDDLIDRVWDGRPPRSAASNLRSCVVRLRAALGPAAITGRCGYRLDSATVTSDIESFRQLREQSARQLLTDALELRRGRPFADAIAVSLIRAEADKLEQQWLVTMEQRMQLDLRAGRSAEIVGELQKLTTVHPYRERLTEQLMIALYRSGRQTEALAAYRRISVTLARDLDARPGRRLDVLHQAVLRQRPELIRS